MTAALDGDVSVSRPVTRTADTETPWLPDAPRRASSRRLAEPAWALEGPNPEVPAGAADPVVARLCATVLTRALAERIARDLPKDQRRKATPATGRSRGPVLVDTAGRSASDDRALEGAAMLADTPGVRTHLVMPAGASLREATRLLETYGGRARRVVLTRLDEADSVSPLMHLFAERNLAVSYLGTGQRVPEDLERATPHNLARHIVGHDASERCMA